jgi:hypothetical protein
MRQPELHLERLSEKLRNVLVTAAGISLSEKERAVIDRLRSGYRQVVASRILYDLRAIAVTGMQGVGKTTFVTRLYDLPAELLPHDVGRDEKVPVIIREHNGKIEVKGTYLPTPEFPNFPERPVPAGELHKLLRRPPADLVVVTVYVPFRIFNDSEQALVLLPGLEYSLDERASADPWEALVRHAVLASAACIFVASPQKLANIENQQNMTRLAERFAGLRPLIVVTHGDMYSPEQMAEYCSTALEQLGSSDSLAVIPVGNSEELAKVWRGQVMARLAEFSGTSAGLRKHQLAQSQELAERTLNDALTDLDEVATNHFDKVDSQEFRQITQVLEKYDRGVAKIRRYFQQNLDIMLDSREGEIGKTLTWELVDEDFFQKIWRVVAGEDLKAVVEREEKLQDLWRGDGKLAELIRNAMETTAKREFDPSGNQQPKESVPIKLGSIDIQTLLTTDEIEAVQWIMTPAKKTPGDPNRKVPALVHRLPALALLFGVLGPRMPLAGSKLLSPNQPLPPLTRAHWESALNDAMEADEMRKRTVATMAAVILGADAADGTINTIPALASALGIELSTSAVAVFAGGAALLAVGAFTLSIRRQLVRQDFERRDQTLLFLQACRDATETYVLSMFDDMMERISDQIRQRLNASHLIDERLGTIQQLKIAVAQAHEERSSFAQAIEYQATHAS